MRHVPNLRIEQYRTIHPVRGGSAPGENWGYFEVPFGLRIIASDGREQDTSGWEHVSVSLASRTPTWGEMQHVKDLFWADNETVLQFHPCKAAYVNCHPYTLHLWRRVGENVELPPTILVGRVKEPTP